MRVSHVRVREFLNPCTTSLREILPTGNPGNIDMTECHVFTVLSSSRSAAVSVRDSRLGDNNELTRDASCRRPLQATRPNDLKHNEDGMLCALFSVFSSEMP